MTFDAKPLDIEFVIVSAMVMTLNPERGHLRRVRAPLHIARKLSAEQFAPLLRHT